MATTFDNAANQIQTTLYSPYTAGSGTMTVASTSGMPTPPFRISVGNAIYRVNSVSGNTLSIGPAIEGTTDNSLPTNTTLNLWFTAGHYQDHSAAINNLENSGSAAPPGTNGSLLYNSSGVTAGSTLIKIDNPNGNLYIRDDASTNPFVHRISVDQRTTNFISGALRLSGSKAYDNDNYNEVACVDVGWNTQSKGTIDFYTGGDINRTAMVKAGSFDYTGRLVLNYGLIYSTTNTFQIGDTNSLDTNSIMQISCVAGKVPLVLQNNQYFMRDVLQVHSGPNTNNIIASLDFYGGYHPPQLDDSTGLNNSIYYSTTQSKLVYKDANGQANPLY